MTTQEISGSTVLFEQIGRFGCEILTAGVCSGVDYVVATLMMNTAPYNAALFGLVDGIVSIGFRKIIFRIYKWDFNKDSIPSLIGKTIVIGIIFFGGIKGIQHVLSLAGYPISYRAAIGLCIANLIIKIPAHLIRSCLLG